MLLLMGRWIFLYYGFIHHDLARDKDSYYIDENGMKQRKKHLRRKDLENLSIEEIDMIERSGTYIIPLELEEKLERFRHKKVLKESNELQIFNYNKKQIQGLQIIDENELKQKQNENLKAQQFLK